MSTATPEYGPHGPNGDRRKAADKREPALFDQRITAAAEATGCRDSLYRLKAAALTLAGQNGSATEAAHRVLVLAQAGNNLTDIEKACGMGRGRRRD